MQSVSVLILLAALVACAFGACVSPPSDLNVCPLPAGASIPQEYANTNADRELQSYFNFLEGIKATPTKKCAEAYIAFACSRAYPKCVGDANSGLGLAENTCYYLCSDLLKNVVDNLLVLKDQIVDNSLSVKIVLEEN